MAGTCTRILCLGDRDKKFLLGRADGRSETPNNELVFSHIPPTGNIDAIVM